MIRSLCPFMSQLQRKRSIEEEAGRSVGRYFCGVCAANQIYALTQV
jgi:hypothetical protein